MWIRHGYGLVMAGMLWGCTTIMPETPLQASGPIFQADTTDTEFLQTVYREQAALLSTCTQHQSCDKVHFTRAMIALFQNGESAVASFHQAIAVAPKGPYADSSAHWIRFLADRTFHPASVDEANEGLAVMKGLVRIWLGQQRTASASAAMRAGETAQTPAVPTLRRQIRSRDKRIAELIDQLSALKQIDSDAHRNSKLTLSKTPSK